MIVGVLLGTRHFTRNSQAMEASLCTTDNAQEKSHAWESFSKHENDRSITSPSQATPSTSPASFPTTSRVAPIYPAPANSYPGPVTPPTALHASSGNPSVPSTRTKPSITTVQSTAGIPPASSSTVAHSVAPSTFQSPSAPAATDTQTLDIPVPTATIDGSPVSIPAILAEPDPATMTPAQIALSDALAQEFVQAIGGTAQDPSGTEYASKWFNAQQISDDRYRTMFGQDAFLRNNLKTAYGSGTGTP